MGFVADHATFAQGLVLEHKWPRLLPVALRAAFVLARHSQAAFWFRDVQAVWIVALNAVHVPFIDGMMLGQPKLRFDFEMAVVARPGIFARVDDECPAPAPRFDMFAPRSVAGFAPRGFFHSRRIDVDARMWTGRKGAGDVGVAIITGLVANKLRSRNLRRGYRRAREMGAGKQQQSAERRCQTAQRQPPHHNFILPPCLCADKPASDARRDCTDRILGSGSLISSPARDALEFPANHGLIQRPRLLVAPRLMGTLRFRADALAPGIALPI